MQLAQGGLELSHGFAGLSLPDTVSSAGLISGMAFQKVHLHDVAGQGQQALEIAQSRRCDAWRLWVAFSNAAADGFGELQEALHDAQALWAASLMHGLGPSAGQ